MTITLEPIADQTPVKTVSLDWESVCCNLCGADDPELYHRERLPYFDQMLTFDIVRCRQCHLVYTNPRLADHNRTYLYPHCADPQSISDHDQAKQQVFIGALAQTDRLQSLAPEKRPPRLLDIGCGSGHFLNLARQRGFEVYGIEPAPASADYAENRHGLSVIRDDILHADLPPASFDVITAWDVIEHVSDPQAVLRQCVAWLRPGGIMALRFPSARWQKIKAVILHRLLSSPRPVFSPTMHLYFFNPDTFARLARQVHLEIIRVKTTPLERNAENHLVDAAKTIASITLRALASLSGAHLGNLEIYCRKPNHD